MILYNTHNYWHHTLVTAADLMRVIDDLGRFRVLMDYLHDPFCGLHGSFLLVNGAVMKHVTWNTDCLVEDYWLALEVRFPSPLQLYMNTRTSTSSYQFTDTLLSLQARQSAFKFEWVPAFAREQSPDTLHDWFQQRRRWYTGIWQLSNTWGKSDLISDAWYLLDYSA